MFTQIEKNKLISYIKTTPDKNIYYGEIVNLLNKNNRNKKNLTAMLLEFYSDYVLKLLSKDDVTNNSISRFLSAILTIMTWVASDELEISNDIIANIRRIDNCYKEFISRTGKESSEEVNSALEKIVEVVGKEEVMDDALIQLKETIRELTLQIKDNSNIIASLETDLQDKNRNINSMNRKIEKLNQELLNRKNEIDRLSELVKDYDSDVTRLNNENKGLVSYVETLNEDNRLSNLKVKELSSKIEELMEVIWKLKSANNELINILDSIKNNRDLDEDKIESIIEVLFNRDLTKEEIIKELKGKVTYDNFNSLFKKAKDRVAIGVPSISVNPNYSIIVPPVMENRVFNINNSNLTVDVLLTSDYHINFNNMERDYGYIESIYDYCEENGINIVINLGDFFGFKYEDISRYQKYRQGKDLVNRVIDTFPSRNGIYHAVLGGNHDEDALRYGYDAIDMLTKDREDMINLGYTHALVTFDNVMSPLSSLLLHHIDRRIKDPIEFEEYNDSDYKRYLDSYVRLNGKDAYVHLLGGAHLSGVYSNFILVPSLTCNRNVNGAMRLRIYFDLDNKISNIVVIPLVVDDYMKEVTEVVFKKTK